MVRLLLTVFFVGLVVSCACWAAVAAMGGPDTGWPKFTRYDDGHTSRWSWTDDGGGDRSHDHDYAVGQVATRDIAWNGSNRLEVNFPAEIDYTQGPGAKVTVTGPKNLIDMITINDGVINYDNNWAWKRRNANIHMTIQAPAVTQFELNGAAKININSYRQDSMDLEVNGAAKVNASGQANRLHMELNGASSAEMGSLLNDDADVQLNGASSVTMGPRRSARVEINGVGHARLMTHPANMQQEIHGVGSITYDTDSSDTPPAPLPPANAAQPTPAPTSHGPAAKTSKAHSKTEPV